MGAVTTACLLANWAAILVSYLAPNPIREGIEKDIFSFMWVQAEISMQKFLLYFENKAEQLKQSSYG